MRYSVIEEEDLLNAETIVNQIITYDSIWHSDFYIIRINTKSQKEMAYIYGLNHSESANRIKNMCLVIDDGAVVVMINSIAMQTKADMITYISDEIFSNLCKMGYLHKDDIPDNINTKNKN